MVTRRARFSWWEVWAQPNYGSISVTGASLGEPIRPVAVAPEAEVERRRREDRGTEGAEGGRVRGGGVPLPTGGELWGGAVPPPQTIFRFLSSKRRVLVHPWCYFLQLINLN